MLTLDVGLVIYKCFVLKCPEMTEGRSVVVFSMLMEGGVRSTSCNLDCRGSGDK